MQLMPEPAMAAAAVSNFWLTAASGDLLRPAVVAAAMVSADRRLLAVRLAAPLRQPAARPPQSAV